MVFNMEQRTPEWYAWRENKIGASASATIMGLNPYQTVLELWEEMVGLVETQPINHHMQRGIELEDEARSWIEVVKMTKFPAECMTHPKHPWMICSYDGINHNDELIVEIKCPSHGVHARILRHGIPDMYMCQMQHQLAVCGYKEGIFLSYTKENPKYINISRDDKFIEEMIQKEYDFWMSVQKFEKPSYEVV
jgi:putative phage-type endonuclease